VLALILSRGADGSPGGEGGECHQPETYRTNEAEAVVVDLDLVAVTRERGSAEALAILHAAQVAIGASPLAVAEHRLSLILIRETLVRHDEARALTRATARLRAFLHIL
jgi:hypothetical protein